MYEPFYDVVKMTTLPPDPRLKRRANRRGLSTFLLGLVFALWVATAVTAAALDWRFGPTPLSQLVLPWNVLGWTISYDLFATYPNAHFDAYIHHGFAVGRIAFGVALALGIGWTFLDVRRALASTAAFPNEGRDARWALPEELFSPTPTESLFPVSYDVQRGFAREDRARRRDQRERAESAIAQRQRANRQAVK